MIEHRRLSRGAMSTRIIDHCVPPAVGGGSFSAPEFEYVQMDTNSGVYVEVCSVNGPGMLNHIIASVADNTGRLRITLDGYVDILTVSIAVDHWYVIWPNNVTDAAKYIFAPHVHTRARVYFQDEFKLETRIASASRIYVKCYYGEI